MAKKKPILPVLKCNQCDFSTKNRYIYLRHKNRCSRISAPPEYGPSSSTVDANSTIASDRGESFVGEETSYIDESMEINTEDASEETSELKESESEPITVDGEGNEENQSYEEIDPTPVSVSVVDAPPQETRKMPKILLKLKTTKSRVAPNRNYTCDKCNFGTTKSKSFLYHLLNKHNAAINIFACTFCDYACRWKHKLLRHMKMIHKNITLPPVEDIQAEVMCNKPKKPTEAKQRPPTKVTITKNASGVLQVKKKKSMPLKINSNYKVSDQILDLSKSENNPHFKCKVCIYSSRMRARVYNHIMSCHVHAKQFQCKHCDFTTTKKTDYYAHNAAHGDQKVWSCEDCSYTTSFKPNYERHRINHNRNLSYKCEVCTYTTDHEGALKRHVMYSHPQGSPVKESKTTSQSSHIKDISDEDNFTDDCREVFPLLPGFKRCELCGFLGMSDVEVEVHMELHKQSHYFPCQICKLKYKRSGDLNRHMKLKHILRLKDFIRRQGTQYQIEIASTGEITIPSITGSKAKVVKKEVKPHKTPEKKIAVEVHQNQDEEDNEIQFRAQGVDQPLDLSMTSPEKTPNKLDIDPEELQCPDCVYVAKWPSDLRRHSVVHSIEKRFQCNFCDKKYKYSGDLNVHMRRDHKEEPKVNIKAEKTPFVPKRKTGVFRCSSCSYTSAFKSEIARHSKCHTDSKPHHCILCDYESHWKGDVKRHIQKHHPKVLTSTVPLEDFIKTSVEEEPMEELQHVEPETSTPARSPVKEMSPVPHHGSPIKERSPVPNQGSAEKNQDIIVSEDPNSKEQIFKCKYCLFTASAPSKLKAHVITHVNLKQWKCSVCPRRSNWKWDIRKHILRDHPNSSVSDVIMLSEEEAKATIQDYISNSTMPKRENHLDNMNIAEAQDELKFPYRCSACGFNSSYRWEVSKHLRMSHPGENCSVVVAFSTESAEEEALSQPVQEPVPKLDIRSLLKRSLVKANANNDSSTTVTASEESSVHDDNNPEDLAEHSRKRTRSKKAEEGLENKLYMCGECGKRCVSHGDVKKHYKYMHQGKEIKIIYLGDAAVSPGNQKKSSLSPSPSSKRGSYEARYSNPKAIGYIKPFQCSVCLRRSNWKWDINKHMRESHAGVPYHLIILSEEEARATLATYIPPMQQQAYQRAKLANAGGQPLTPGVSLTPYRSLILRNLKQFKCSVCTYRSDWRSDTHRHIKNKHGRNKASIILLDPNHAKATLESYIAKRQGGEKRVLFPKPIEPVKATVSRRSSVESSSSTVTKSEETNATEAVSFTKGRLWKCSKCPYRNKKRKLVSIHLKSHKLKPFNCKICGHASNHRSALYRHLRGKHNSNDFTLCHMTMQYMKEENMGVDDFNEEADMTMEELEELDAEQEMEMKKDEAEDKLLDQKRAFHCSICGFQTTWRSCARRHLRERHGTTDFTQCVIKPLDPNAIKKKGRKKYYCTKCPYQTEKPGLLKFHMTNHKPQPGNRYKCKYCPYYVCAKRLLHQHLRIHAQTPGNIPATAEPRSSVSNKRYQCEKCPFMTGSKNDILYHKQFHRPRPNATFKCDFCDYWVTHRRLLKQHNRMHKAAEMAESPVKAGPPSIMSSPCKSEMTDASWFYNPVDAASIKQQVISSKITKTLPVPGMTPVKSGSGPSGFFVRNGVFRKFLHCRFCPYVNIRTRNLRLHEKMHGWRLSDKPLFQCSSCNYMVGSKGLLSHHMKVHSKGYGMDPSDNTTADLENLEGIQVEGDEQSDRSSEISDQQHDSKMDALLEIARFKKYACEKCPYASAKRNHFERHLELHGSKQRYLCDFCDYSVPSNNLLLQHQKLHLMPNQNLLAVQSITNLQHLPEITADVAVASFLSAYNPEKEKTVNVTHDHMELYENHPEPPEELKKLYRCDRCPYANVRRDHLLGHLKFHMVRSELSCPYCDYSVSKSHLLHQHIKVHFSPLPEFSEWAEKNGPQGKAEDGTLKENSEDQTNNNNNTDYETKTLSMNNMPSYHLLAIKDAGAPEKSLDKEYTSESKLSDQKENETQTQNDITSQDSSQKETASSVQKDSSLSSTSSNYICQYCDREFTTSEHLVSHEMQHLIGNHFEANKLLELPSPELETESPVNMATNESSVTMATTVNVQDETEPMEVQT